MSESSQTQPKDSSLEIQIQDELEKDPLNNELEIKFAADTNEHRQNMRNFFDSVCSIFLCV